MNKEKQKKICLRKAEIFKDMADKTQGMERVSFRSEQFKAERQYLELVYGVVDFHVKIKPRIVHMIGSRRGGLYVSLLDAERMLLKMDAGLEVKRIRRGNHAKVKVQNTEPNAQ